MGWGRGQSAVEMMIILAVSMVALLVVYSMTATQTVQIQAQQRVQAGQTAVDSIANAANDVFFQGNGAKKRVFVLIPEDVNASATLISGKELNLRVGSTDVFAVADVNVVGSLPTSAGGTYLTLVAHENYVSLNDTSLSVSKNSVYLATNPDANASTQVTVTNNSSAETATVTLVKTWNNAPVTFTLSTASFTINPGASQVIDFNFLASASATGNYAGSVKVNADFNGSSPDENISLPVNVDVTAAPSQPGADFNLTIVPSTWTETLDRNTVDTNSYEVCNTSALSMPSVSFVKSGTAGSWVYDINAISPLNADSCAAKTITISPPGSLSEQTATGTITATGNSSTDTISLTITIRIRPLFGQFTPSSGFDATGAGHVLTAANLNALNASDNTRYTSDTTWPKNASSFDDALYIELVFSPNVPAGSTIQDVNLTHEYSLSGAATAVARLKIWNADTNSWSTQSLTGATSTTDVSDALNLFSSINSVNAVNNFKVRFQMYVTTATARTSRQDFVQLGVKYKPP